jgi:hypothetical protein
MAKNTATMILIRCIGILLGLPILAARISIMYCQCEHAAMSIIQCQKIFCQHLLRTIRTIHQFHHDSDTAAVTEARY